MLKRVLLTATGLIDVNGWTNGQSWDFERYTLDEAIEAAIDRHKIEDFLRPQFQQRVREVIVKAADLTSYAQVKILHDSQLPREGQAWSLDLLRRARET